MQEASRGLADTDQLGGDGRSSQKGGRQLGEKRCLPLALLGFARALPRSPRQVAHHQARHHVHGEDEPVLAPVQRQLKGRRDEGEVEQEHARYGDADRPHTPEEESDREHREHVQRAEAQRRRDALE